MKAMEQLLEFISRLQEKKIHFTLQCVREAIMVAVVSSARYFEIEFFADGTIEVQTFTAGSVEEMTLDRISKIVIEALDGPASGK